MFPLPASALLSKINVPLDPKIFFLNPSSSKMQLNLSEEVLFNKAKKVNAKMDF